MACRRRHMVCRPAHCRASSTEREACFTKCEKMTTVTSGSPPWSCLPRISGNILHTEGAQRGCREGRGKVVRDQRERSNPYLSGGCLRLIWTLVGWRREIPALLQLLVWRCAGRCHTSGPHLSLEGLPPSPGDLRNLSTGEGVEQELFLL